MTSTFIELEFSPFVLDFSHPALIRDRLGSPDDRDESYDDRYDFSTLFYDCYFDQIANEWDGLDAICANAGIAGPTAAVEDVQLADPITG